MYSYYRNEVEFLTNSYKLIHFISIAIMQGTIKKLTDKNFGFISQEDSDKDLFFHGNSLDGISFDELREGDNVTFEVEQGDKGPSAINVKKA